MSLEDLLAETGRFLTEKNQIMYLHLDEFIPSDPRVCKLFLKSLSLSEFESGELQGVDVLHAMWREAIMKLLTPQRVMLFATGESKLFD